MADQVEPIFGQLKGITAPIGTILGPIWDGRYLVIVGYEAGVAQLGYAGPEHIQAAHTRCTTEHVYHSFTELSIFGAVGFHKTDQEQQKAALRTNHMQRIGAFHGVHNG